MPSTSFYEIPQPSAPFRPGSVVIATLANPREKFWGAILHLSPTGLSLRGVDLSSFDDFVAQIRDGEPLRRPSEIAAPSNQIVRFLGAM